MLLSHGGLRPSLLCLVYRRPVAGARGHHRDVFRFPRWAYAPRSWRNERCVFSVKITPFAVQERTFTRAAGVSPPWVLGKCTCRYAAAKSRQTTIAVPTNAGAFACSEPTGGLRPPLLALGRVFVHRRNNAFCDAETHVHKSGGRQPAVGVSNAVAIANAFTQRRARQPAVAG
jgi:hypothetical protein